MRFLDVGLEKRNEEAMRLIDDNGLIGLKGYQGLHKHVIGQDLRSDRYLLPFCEQMIQLLSHSFKGQRCQTCY